MTKQRTKQELLIEIAKLQANIQKRNDLLLSLTAYFKTIEDQLEIILNSIKEVGGFHIQLTTKMALAEMEESNDSKGN